MARVQAGYFGFASREAANTFAEAVNERFGVDVTIRTPQRLSGVLLEAKVRDFDGLEALCWEKAQKAEVTLQEARESLQQDCFYDANDTWSKPFYSEDGQWVGVDEEAFECYSYEDWQADREDLRASSSSF